MEENKQLEVINPNSLLSLNKSDIKTLAKSAVLSVTDGWLDPLDALITIRKTKEFLDAMEEDIKPIANDQTISKGYSKYNVDIAQEMLGVKYDYSECNDEEWNKLNDEMKALKKKITKRETFLKSIEGSLEVVDTVTGETHTIYPPIKSGALGLKLTVK